MVNNPNKYSEMGTGSSLNDIRDDDDFPHVGIIKALSDGLGQNYAVSGFNATNISATSVDISDGKIFRDGKLVDITGDTLTISAGSSGTGDTYALLVAPASGNVTRRLNTVKGKTPSITAGDTIIGVLVHTGSSPMQLQYLTLDKTENSQSIGYSNSGTYTEAMSIEGTSTKTTFHNKIADADVRFVLGDNTADEKFEIVTDDDADGDLTDTLTEVFSVNGLGATSIAGTVNLGSVVNAGTDTDKFLVLDSGGNVDFRTGTEVRSDIGAGTLSVESDTLDSVVNRGNSTANDITCGTITSNDNQNISYEVVAHPASPIITGGKTVAYIHNIAALGNTLQLPAPASGNILYIKNIFTNPITITGNPLINLDDTTHPKITAPSVITLAPFEHVTLQAVNDSQTPLVLGHMIISD